MDEKIKLLLLIGLILHFADSLTTYYILAAGIGKEANPLLAPLYHQNPLYTFLVFVPTSAAVVGSVYGYSVFAESLNPEVRVKMYKVFVNAFAVIVGLKAVPVANNIILIAAGWAPVGDLISKLF